MRRFLTIFFVFLCVSAFSDELFKSGVTASFYADKFHGRKTASGSSIVSRYIMIKRISGFFKFTLLS